MPAGERSSRGEKARHRRPAAPPWRHRASQRADGLRLWTRSSTPAPATDSQRGLLRCRRYRYGEDGKQPARSGRREDERDNESSRWTTWCCRERFLNLHFHCVFLEGVYLDRTDQGLTPRFLTGEPPSDADIAAVVQKISHQSSARCDGWDTWRRVAMTPCTRGMIRCATTPPNSPVPWRPRCSSASPLANGLDSRSGAWARALTPRASAL